MLASATYATRRGLTRPFARGMAQRRRLGQKLSFGLTPAQAARLEGLGTGELDALLQDPGFQALLDGYRALLAMPEEEQRRILASLARHLLMEALAHGDVRVACFILLQERIGKDPARTLADGVIAAGRRAPRPVSVPGPPAPQPRPAYPSDDPERRSLRQVETRLCHELAQEHAAVHAAVAGELPSDELGAPPQEAGPPVEPGDGQGAGARAAVAVGAPGTRPLVTPRPGHPGTAAARPLLSDHQRHALARLRDEPPAPRARSP